MAKSPRAQIKELKDQMQSTQREAALDLLDLIKNFQSDLKEITERTIPGEIVEQSITNVENALRQIPTWLQHVVVAPEQVASPEELPEAPKK